ncbi:MAG: gamma carbonic anhydrase family protein [Nitrososphaerota archaeon]|nr:gamma carbonic anhydrase family protein [Nitrososphaerota archaeon]
MIQVSGKQPVIHPTAYIAPGAWVVGDVRIASDVSVWFNAVLRGDLASLSVGSGCNIRDGTVIHPAGVSAVIGERVTVGHGCRLEGVYIEDEALIGMGAVLLEGARVGRGSLVSAGSVLPADIVVPAGSLVMGNPARVVGEAEGKHRKMIQEGWKTYEDLADAFRTSRKVRD